MGEEAQGKVKAKDQMECEVAISRTHHYQMGKENRARQQQAKKDGEKEQQEEGN
jgi:hypothetical protein